MMAPQKENNGHYWCLKCGFSTIEHPYPDPPKKARRTLPHKQRARRDL